ncbi:porin family protein [Aquimarina algicola]|uniref:PorT family protein n=1 Tax=Aquimarina algicola TaxID=2589995 RepID=A0A504JPL6_9FLAO|nr:porin family protein [Aquimarina algicola]TPN88691.1 PorT family protein [Aquimarina algicola]
MKKLFFLVIACIGFAVTTTNAQGIKFGIKGGLNFANFNELKNSDLDIDTDSRTGYHIGAVLQLGLTESFAIQPEVLYSAQGTDDLDVDYLNIPVLAKFKFAKFLSIEAGPQFGFVVNDDIDKAFDEIVDSAEAESFDLSGAIGAGVEFGPFFGQLRYNFGLTDVVDGFDGRNTAFQVSVGYYIF